MISVVVVGLPDCRRATSTCGTPSRAARGSWRRSGTAPSTSACSRPSTCPSARGARPRPPPRRSATCGSPSRSASLSMVSAVSSSASWLARNCVYSPASFWLISASFALSAAASLAPRNVKFFQYSPRQPLLLRGERRLRGRVVDRLDPRVELCVLRDLVGVRGEQRLHLGLDRAERVAVEAPGPDVVHRLNALQRASGALERDDRVVERRRVGAIRDRVDLGEVLGPSPRAAPA